VTIFQDETLQRIQRLATAAVDPDPRRNDIRRRVSIARIIQRGAEMRPYDGAELEYLTEQSRIAGKPYDQTRPTLGWDVLSRADTAGVGSQGGYTVGTEVGSAVDALRPTTVTVQLGATIIEAKGNFALPRQTGVATANWLSTESTVGAESDSTYSQVGFTPHTVSAYSEASRQLLLQSNADMLLRRDILSVLGRAIDKAALHGPGIAGQPLGLTNISGVGTFSGSSLAISGVTGAFVGLGDALGQRGGAAANRTTAGLLRQRPENTGSEKTLWSGQLTNGTVLDYPARSSTAINSGNLIIGSWEYLVIATWGGGVELMVNPFGDSVTGPQNFQKGIYGYRALCSMDVGCIFPTAFTVASAVT
jgi:HK97 family phage major capsid protein